MTRPTIGAKAPTQKSDAKPALLGVACGLGAALFWALGFVATRHGLKVGFVPADLLMHRFLRRRGTGLKSSSPHELREQVVSLFAAASAVITEERRIH